MKKALSAAMAAGMTAVMLAGCGSSASSAAESTAPAESTSAAASTEAAAESVVSAPTALSFVFADGDDNFKTEMNKIVDNFATKESFTIFKGWLINNHFCPLRFHTFHDALNGCVTQIIRVRFHRQAINTNGASVLFT